MKIHTVRYEVTSARFGPPFLYLIRRSPPMSLWYFLQWGSMEYHIWGARCRVYGAGSTWWPLEEAVEPVRLSEGGGALHRAALDPRAHVRRRRFRPRPPTPHPTALRPPSPRVPRRPPRRRNGGGGGSRRGSTSPPLSLLHCSPPRLARLASPRRSGGGRGGGGRGRREGRGARVRSLVYGLGFMV